MFRNALILVLGLIVCGCAGKPLSQVELPVNELPKEYVSKFDVKDTSAQADQAKPSLIPLADEEKPAKKTKAHKKKAKKVQQLQAQEPTPFVIPNRRPKVDPLWVGEKLSYEITYFGMAAAEVTTEILPFKEI